MAIKCLLMSNSSFPTYEYLMPWRAIITRFFKENGGGKNIIFIPYAVIQLTYDKYLSNVSSALSDLTIKSIHNEPNLTDAIEKADGIIIGGGNTFHLKLELEKAGILNAITNKVQSGTPYVGWSAGSNIATPDIGTTNDMPVVWPSSELALNLVPFNINPHYSNWKPPAYAGEGRDDRLEEAVLVKKRTIVALSEGTAVRVNDSNYGVFLCPKEFEPPQHESKVKVWKPTNDNTFTVTEVPLSYENETPLNPFL